MLKLPAHICYFDLRILLFGGCFSYWVDYLRAFAGTDASMPVVQSQCDTPSACSSG
jgi:hypothetical protein